MGLKLVILAWVISAWMDDETITRARTILSAARTMLDNRRSSFGVGGLKNGFWLILACINYSYI